MLLCFGRLKGGQCDSEGWPENVEDLGLPSQEGLHLGAGARGTAPCPLTACYLRCFVGVVGVRAFKLLQEDGCVDSSHMASTHLQQHDRTVEVRFE